MRSFLSACAITLALISCSNVNKKCYTMPNPEDVVMYQINPRLFSPTNSLNAILPHLDSIKSLGTNVVWIMPVYPIGKVKSKNSPYSIADYQAINPEFGTFDDFKTLVDECHKRGMAFIMDWVANHTAWDNVWMKEHKDWYTQNEAGEVIYTPGTDWTDVADLNYDNKEMRTAMINAMLYWVEKAGVDGFRCDVADFVPSDFWKEAISAIREKAGRKILMLAEGNDPKTFEGGFDMNYGWDYLTSLRNVFCKDSSATKLIDTDLLEYSKIPSGKIKLRFITNHDEATKKSTISEFGGARGAMAAFVSTIFTNGAALVYGEQEVAYPDTINFFKYQKVDWLANNDVRWEYKHLLKIFSANPKLHKGFPVSFSNKDVLAYKKETSDGVYVVIVNVRKHNSIVSLPQDMVNVPFENLISGKMEIFGNLIPLEPFEYRILKK